MVGQIPCFAGAVDLITRDDFSVPFSNEVFNTFSVALMKTFVSLELSLQTFDSPLSHLAIVRHVHIFVLQR